MFDIRVDGKQIALGRREVINRAIEVALAKTEHIDWREHDLLIQVIPSTDHPTEGA